MIADGEASGALLPGRHPILDATSGNTGIAYAMIGAARGYARAAVRARQRHARAASACCARSAPSVVLDRSDGRHRRRDPRGARALRRASPTATSTPTSITTTPTGARTTTRPALEILRADRRPRHALRRRPRHERHVRRRRRGGCASDPPRRPADLGAARLAAARRRRAEAHGDGDRARHLRSARCADEDLRVSTEDAHALTRAAGAQRQGCSSACRAARSAGGRARSRRADRATA